jgi:hypothetical protein
MTYSDHREGAPGNFVSNRPNRLHDVKQRAVARLLSYRDVEWAERDEITLEAAAKIVGVCNITALHMLRRVDIRGRQVCPGAPWVIKTADLTGFIDRKRSAPPRTPNPGQQTFDFQ